MAQVLPTDTSSATVTGTIPTQITEPKEPTATQTAALPQPGSVPTPVQAPLTATTESTQTNPAPMPTPAASPHLAPPTTEAVATTAAVPAGTTFDATPATGPTSTPGALETSPAQGTESDAEEQEPQNTLTNKFSDAEWAALKKFRAELPQILADGFPDDPKANEKPITFWGVNIDPKGPKDARVSVVLMKFLRARNLSVPDAREMLVSTLRWRTSINIDTLMKEEFPEDVFGNVGRISGRDKDGRPVVYNIYGGNNISEVFRDTERFIRWRVAFHEKSIAMLDFAEIDQTVQIHDYLGVSLTSRDAKSKAAASEASNIFQSHYPELLYRKFFVNVPTLLNWIFWVFKPLLPAATLAKMSVVGTGHHALKKALSPIIDPSELPKQYGGDAKGW